MGAVAGPSRRTVLLHGAVYTTSRILNQGVVFLLLPLYAHLLGSAGMGVVEVMVVTRNFFGVVLVQGLDRAWFRLRFEASEPAALKRFESSIVWYLLVSSLVGVGLVAAVGTVLGRSITPGVPFMPLGVWAACTGVATAFGVLLERSLQAEQRPFAFAVWNLTRTIVTLSGIIVFVVVLRRGAAGKVEGEALAAGAAALLSIALIRPALTLSWAEVKRALIYGLPLVPHALAALVNDLADRFLLSALIGLQSVGVYSMGYRVAGITMLVTVAVNQAFAPLFIETVRKAEAADASGERERSSAHRNRVAELGFVTVLVACAVAQGITASAREVLLLATTREFSESWTVVAPVCVGVVAWGWYATLSQSLFYRQATVRRIAAITIAAAVANIAANLVLIPRFGIHGAAWATALSNTVMAAGAYVIGMKTLPLPYAFRRWAAVTAWTVLSLGVMVALDASLTGIATRVAAKAGWLAVSLGITIMLSGIPLRALRTLLRRQRTPDT